MLSQLVCSFKKKKAIAYFKAPGAWCTGGFLPSGTSDGIAGNGDAKEERLFYLFTFKR